MASRMSFVTIIAWRLITDIWRALMVAGKTPRGAIIDRMSIMVRQTSTGLAKGAECQSEYWTRWKLRARKKQCTRR
jgi:hypothetical protein